MTKSYNHYENIRYCIDEFSRRGNFDLLFPLNNNVEYYSKFISEPDVENILIWLWLNNGSLDQLPFKMFNVNKDK